MKKRRSAISVKRFCQEYGLGRTLAYQLINSNKVTSILIGRRRLILVDSIDAMIEERLKSGGSN